MKNLLYVLLFLLTFILGLDGQNIINGRVADASSEQPIDYATVMVLDKESKEMIQGVTTENLGKFSIEVNETNVYLEVSFLGYETITLNDITFNNGVANVGVVQLGMNATALDEVVVRAEKSSTEFKLDKRVFNVGQDLSSTGASALEVLNNVPSVNVNIEGAVSLRGSAGVQILINGKPSILTNEQGNALGTITADMIEKVEVITNPSAKYEAEGTAGIINIVLKKDEKKGVNGSISLNTGYPQNHSLGFSLNKRTEKLNLFTQLGVGYRVLPSDVRNINENLLTGRTIYSEGVEYRNENFYNLILGADYYFNPLNVMTISGSFAYEIEQQPSETNFQMTDAAGDLVKEWKREETTSAFNPKVQYELQYKRDFVDDEDHQLLFSAIGNYFGKTQSSEFTNTLISGADDFSDQRTRTQFNEGKYTFNLDYTKPFNEQWTLETGAQYIANDVSNDFEVSNCQDGNFVIEPGFTNVFNYYQNVLGVYGTGAFEGEKWGLKLGLRAENTDLRTVLENTNEENDQNFTNWFPTAHTSYKISERFSAQAGYSRRIFRPRLWDLNPFFNIRNNFNVRTGNPNLLPEFSDSYEVGAIYILDKASLNATAYYRYTTDVVERFVTFEDNVSTFKPFNIGTRKSTGLEFNFKYEAAKFLTFTGDANYFTFQREGQYQDVNFDFTADQWSSKLTSKLKFSKSLDFEVTGRYESEERTVQGTNSDNLWADLGMRYKIGKGRAVFNLSVRDVFASRVRETFTEQANFSVYSRQQRGRFVSLGFSYGFGKGEAMQYSGSRRH
ncbi:TonB-dependent receptor domain-containing protein [Portibacter marinus]|uniref:TonB-dependent receptor domain-containing protein n=1 Tax=Portibacter marinus TaxID=2898660 RepID=UPI001F183E38|nr:TonB-dependent receptor [Portibacter marinus]